MHYIKPLNLVKVRPKLRQASLDRQSASVAGSNQKIATRQNKKNIFLCFFLNIFNNWDPKTSPNKMKMSKVIILGLYHLPNRSDSK